MEEKGFKKLSRLSNIYVTIICLTPILWLLVGLFNNISEKTRIISTIMSIPCLILIGFIFGRDSRNSEVFRIASEADELEKELNELKKKKHKNVFVKNFAHSLKSLIDKTIC